MLTRRVMVTLAVFASCVLAACSAGNRERVVQDLAADPLAAIAPANCTLVQSIDQVGKRSTPFQKGTPTRVTRVYETRRPAASIAQLQTFATAHGWMIDPVADGSLHGVKQFAFGEATVVVAAQDSTQIIVTLAPSDPDL